MVTSSKKRESTGTKKRFIGKPAGQIQERVQAVGPERFGVVAVDCGPFLSFNHFLCRSPSALPDIHRSDRQ